MGAETKSKAALLGALRFVGCALILYLASLVASGRQPLGNAVTHAYLFKLGHQYAVAWYGLDNPSEPKAFRFVSLEQARQHLSRLGVRQASRREREQALAIERIWVRPSDPPMLFWKTRGSVFTHRLTFEHPPDALFFFRAFETGAYTTSPFGHAIYFQTES